MANVQRQRKKGSKSFDLKKPLQANTTTDYYQGQTPADRITRGSLFLKDVLKTIFTSGELGDKPLAARRSSSRRAPPGTFAGDAARLGARVGGVTTGRVQTSAFAASILMPTLWILTCHRFLKGPHLMLRG